MEGRGRYEYGGRETRTFQKLHGYKDLVVWQKASDLAYHVHAFTARLGPGYYRTVDQMRAAAQSVHANIAEGYCHTSLAVYIRHCNIARGSLGELGSQIQDCERWGLLDAQTLVALVDLYADTSYLLDGLLRSLHRKQKKGDWNNTLGIAEDPAPYTLDLDPDLSDPELHTPKNPPTPPEHQ
ncbi:MAG: four helix bundle protein [Caldilineae bacterium]|nr:MAG: four helix bundle protein [Caldilineae bacterium]